MKSNVPSTMFTTDINKGGLLIPTDKWLTDVSEMDQLFMQHHPKERLVKGVGLTEGFIKKLTASFPERKPEVLAFFCRARTRARIRHINRKIMEPKQGTLHGRRKLIETIF